MYPRLVLDPVWQKTSAMVWALVFVWASASVLVSVLAYGWVWASALPLWSV